MKHVVVFQIFCTSQVDTVNTKRGNDWRRRKTQNRKGNNLTAHDGKRAIGQNRHLNAGKSEFKTLESVHNAMQYNEKLRSSVQPYGLTALKRIHGIK